MGLTTIAWPVISQLTLAIGGIQSHCTFVLEYCIESLVCHADENSDKVVTKTETEIKQPTENIET